ncbi:MAG: chemotaxis protein CheW [Ramlibacter sp.]|nr:chemotaxis protein CheW [Ramlibacter sp.]
MNTDQMSPTEALTRGFAVEQSPVAQVARRTEAANDSRARQGFRLGALGLMVRYEDGSELAEMPEVYRLPNVPAWFCGMANLHGMLTPVFDLSRYLGVEPDAKAKRMLLVLMHGPDAAGIVIDGLPQRLRWSETDVADGSAAPPRLLPHVRGAALVGEQLWFDLDCAALLDALEDALHSSH